MNNDEAKIYLPSGTGTMAVVIGILSVFMDVFSIISGQFNGAVFIVFIIGIPFLIWGINILKDNNKPRIIINYEGIYLQRIKFLISWSYIDNILIETCYVNQQNTIGVDRNLYIVCKDGNSHKIEIVGLDTDSKHIKHYINKYSRRYFFD